MECSHEIAQIYFASFINLCSAEHCQIVSESLRPVQAHNISSGSRPSRAKNFWVGQIPWKHQRPVNPFPVGIGPGFAGATATSFFKMMKLYSRNKEAGGSIGGGISVESMETWKQHIDGRL
jgi:hypothetical protein